MFVNLPVPILEKKRKLTSIFFTLLCRASEGFMKALKAFVKPFEASKRSGKIKIEVNFYFDITFWNARDEKGFTSVDFDVVGKKTLVGHFYPLINKAKNRSNQVSYLVSIHLIFPFSYALFMSWISETLKLDWCKTCRMLILGVINLCKTNFLSCIFYNNTLKLYTQKYHKYINIQCSISYWNLFLVTNDALLVMLQKCFSIALTRFPWYI